MVPEIIKEKVTVVLAKLLTKPHRCVVFLLPSADDTKPVCRHVLCERGSIAFLLCYSAS